MSTTVTGSKRHLNINADEFAGDLNGTVNTATTATTQATSDNSTKVATTAFVKAQGYATGTIPTFSTVGAAFRDLGDVSVVSYVRVNADETLSYLNAAQFLSAIGGTGNTGTVTSVGTGNIHTLSVSGTTAVTLTPNVGAVTDGGGNLATGDHIYDHVTSRISGLATETYVDTSISDLIDSAPGTLNTLNELAAALGDDVNFSTTVTDSIATKLPKSGGTMSGAIAMGNNNITGVNSITFADPGPSEGLTWTNTRIFESPNDLTTNTAGNFQVVHTNTRRLTVDGSGIDVNGNVVVSGTVDGVDIATRDGVLTSTTTTANAALPKSGGTMSGQLKVEVSTSNNQLNLKRTTSATGEFNIFTNNDTLFFNNVANSSYPLKLESSDSATFANDVNIGGDQLTFTNDAASAYIRGADSLFLESDFDNDDSGSKPIYFYTNGTEMARMEATVATFAGEVEAAGLDINGNADISGNLTLSGTYPRIFLTDSNHDDDWSIINNDGSFGIYNDTDTSYALTINGSNNAAFAGAVTIPSQITTGYGVGFTNGSTDFLLYNNTNENVLYMRDTTNGAMITTWGVNDFTVNKNLAVTGDLDLNGDADISGNLSGVDTLSAEQITIDGNSTNVPLYVRSTGTVSYLQIQNSSTGTSGTGDGFTIGANGTAAYLWQRENAVLHIGTNDTSAVTIDASQNATFAGAVTIAGNLTVNGTTTTIDTTNLNVEDNNITLNYSTGDSSASANNAGITIQDAVDASNDATMLWDATNDRFTFSHAIVANGTTLTGDQDLSGYVTTSGDQTITGVKSFTGELHWDLDSGQYAGDPRAVVMGYSGGNYGQLGYNIDFTSTSSTHNRVFNDIPTRMDLYDGINLYSSTAGLAGTSITWGTALLRVQSNGFQYKGNNIYYVGNDSGILNSNVTLSSLGAAASSHTHTFASLTSKPTTISGYGITDAFDGAYGSLSGTPTIPSGNQIIDWTAENAGTIHTSNFADANTNYYLDGITKSGNALIFSVNGATNQTYTFGSNAFNSTTIPSGNAVIDWTQANAGTIHTSNYIENVDYELPIAAGNTLGGIKVGTNLSITAGGVLSSTDTVYTHPTTAGNKHVPSGGASGQFLKYSASGTAVWATPSYTVDTQNDAATTRAFFSGSGIDTSTGVITNTTYTKASTSSLGLVKIGEGVDIDAQGTISVTVQTNASSSNDGLMSSSDKTKIDSVESNADVTDATNVAAAGASMKTSTETISGTKTFSAAVTVSNSTASTSKTTGAVKVTGGIGISGALNVGGDVTAFASSDKRYKDNLQVITNPIDKVKSLTGYTFTWNDKHEQFNGSDDIGVVAQEVEKVFPEIVDTRDNGYKAVKYEKMVAVLIEAVKDQQKQIDELKAMCNGCSN